MPRPGSPRAAILALVGSCVSLLGAYSLVSVVSWEQDANAQCAVHNCATPLPLAEQPDLYLGIALVVAGLVVVLVAVRGGLARRTAETPSI